MSTAYLPLADIALGCGIASHTLLNHFWPAHWGVPGHWRMLPQSSTVVVNELFIPELAKSLTEGGQLEAARRLMTWYGELGPCESHEEFTARHSATPRKPEEPWFKGGQYE